ncbi:MAG TPA: Type 1 glutamine amidotransferase-like domain-containing protein [Pyrinomonadaceae bacterium]|nr:Type 1 glutamine amidotransferase-like domain-containing protein [Pyrinomonadaceae bacterium]
MNPPVLKPNPQPIYLFADSQLLFRRDGGNLFLDSIRRLVTRDSPRAAYVGASNGDAPEFYSIFEAAMDGAGVRDRRMILSSFAAEDRSFLSDADIILLAGGDVEVGWRVFVETGMREAIVRRYAEGAVLMGVSAGAVQLGLYGLTERGASTGGLADAFELVPFVIDAHDEGRRWGRLRAALRLLGGAAGGIGIPAGGGMIYHPGGRVEAVGRPLHELSFEGGEVKDALLLPGPV